ncbi:MAG: 5-(carboxyamino)imidazole ribonucleotide mutase [Planctomycetota bacterium]|nr:MAG: 5-(carboxyamino)imidazole ribonucleotide mutase [Planctomycetota bacterium]
MGSDSDWECMKATVEMLKEFGVPHDVRVVSAHRSPGAVREFALGAAETGFGVIIAAAGGAAHLAGVIASMTTLPVIGVPMQTKLGGIDSLCSTVQMPSGVPVATMSIGDAGAKNAAIFAVQILALDDASLAKRLGEYKVNLAESVVEKNEKVRKDLK